MSTVFALRSAAVLGATGVALGAYGAHGLKKIISDNEKIQTWTTASHYQLFHAVALLALSISTRRHPYVAGLWTTGTAMFSGSIYCLVLNKEKLRFLGPVTPLGGLFLIAGWAALLAP
ncbi:hypothetical protein GGI25_002636 [Coemansia spiralis]|uniref:DUF423-domain-containing protein n=2 Tax=Coemansia TaxID=4863 RepID=A0A9W8G9T5_9FUNG|nr:membrane protein [Coemansia spiralis]KAJ1989823.1 hypothetical protein EDC05_004443 [Coemansia umbellata]KAJ2620613.1 hypothetical protein GGI26_004845 [Coemansia sp. RSA 1358]KAJ2678132.1 hypothetical protein GGI25_002636 [Coemansia spiralis]